MKFVITKSYLEAGLNIVGRAISGKNPRVILTGVKLELNENGLFLTALTASDSYLSIITKIPSVVDNKQVLTIIENGVAVIGARYFTDIVRKFSGEELEIEMIENNILKIKDNISDFSLNCMDPNDYPLIDFKNAGQEFSLATEDLITAINQTTYAASDKETRPILQGVNFKASNGVIECVATDSFRIAKKIIKLDNDLEFSVTVPAKTLNEVAKIAENDEYVNITVNDKRIVFKFENTLVIAGILNGAYPDTSRLIPKVFASKLTVDADKIVSSIDRTASLSNDRQAIVRLSLSEDEIKVMSRTQETGSGNDVIREFEYKGNKLDVSFTARYIIEAVKEISNDQVSISFNGDSSPAIVTSESDDSVLALVLPVRTY